MQSLNNRLRRISEDVIIPDYGKTFYKYGIDCGEIAVRIQIETLRHTPIHKQDETVDVHVMPLSALTQDGLVRKGTQADRRPPLSTDLRAHSSGTYEMRLHYVY